jgi:hypothetical protein
MCTYYAQSPGVVVLWRQGQEEESKWNNAAYGEVKLNFLV